MNNKKGIKSKVEGSLAIATEQEPTGYSQAAKEAYLANAVEINGVKYGTLPIELLRIDTYQRPVQKKVKEIASKWDSEKVGIIEVSYRDDEFWVVDGQNRMEAAKLVGITLLYCQISTNKTKKDEAIAFVHQNDGVTLVSSFDTFNALVEAEDPNALIIKELCNQYHVRYYKERRATTPALGGMSAIMDVCEKFGAEGVEWVLGMVQDLGWHNDRKAYCDAVIRALSNVYASREDKRRLKENLLRNIDGHKYAPCQVITKAMADRPGRGPTVALTQLFESLTP